MVEQIGACNGERLTPLTAHGLDVLHDAMEKINSVKSLCIFFCLAVGGTLTFKSVPTLFSAGFGSQILITTFFGTALFTLGLLLYLQGWKLLDTHVEIGFDKAQCRLFRILELQSLSLIIIGLWSLIFEEIAASTSVLLIAASTFNVYLFFRSKHLKDIVVLKLPSNHFYLYHNRGLVCDFYLKEVDVGKCRPILDYFEFVARGQAVRIWIGLPGSHALYDYFRLYGGSVEKQNNTRHGTA